MRFEPTIRLLVYILSKLAWKITNMKKRLSSCLECGDNTSILTQVSSGPEVTLICANCYSLKYSKESQSEIDHNEDEKSYIK